MMEGRTVRGFAEGRPCAVRLSWARRLRRGSPVLSFDPPLTPRTPSVLLGLREAGR